MFCADDRLFNLPQMSAAMMEYTCQVSRRYDTPPKEPDDKILCVHFDAGMQRTTWPYPNPVSCHKISPHFFPLLGIYYIFAHWGHSAARYSVRRSLGLRRMVKQTVEKASTRTTNTAVLLYHIVLVRQSVVMYGAKS